MPDGGALFGPASCKALPAPLNLSCLPRVLEYHDSVLLLRLRAERRMPCVVRWLQLRKQHRMPFASSPQPGRAGSIGVEASAQYSRARPFLSRAPARRAQLREAPREMRPFLLGPPAASAPTLKSQLVTSQDLASAGVDAFVGQACAERFELCARLTQSVNGASVQAFKGAEDQHDCCSWLGFKAATESEADARWPRAALRAAQCTRGARCLVAGHRAARKRTRWLGPLASTDPAWHCGAWPLCAATATSS